VFAGQAKAAGAVVGTNGPFLGTAHTESSAARFYQGLAVRRVIACGGATFRVSFSHLVAKAAGNASQTQNQYQKLGRHDGI